MSKKMNANIEAAITATENTIIEAATHYSLQKCFELNPNASLRKLAQATGINYGVLLKKSKDPIPGQAYDPEATNWAALEQKLTDKGVDWNCLNWGVLNAGPNRKGASLQKNIDAFKVGDKVYLRRDNTTPYEIVYKTETHVVIMKEGTSEPQAWANNTFLINGPVFEPRAEKSPKVDVAPEPEAVTEPEVEVEVEETEAAQ